MKDFVWYPGWFEKNKAINFIDIDFEYVIMDRCNMSKSIFLDGSIKRCSFQQSMMEEATFQNNLVEYVDFQKAMLKETDFKNSTVNFCRFDLADLKNSRFLDESILQGNSFQYAYMINVYSHQDVEAFLNGNDYTGANMTGAYFGCGNTFETDEFSTADAAAPLAMNYSEYFPPSSSSLHDQYPCRDAHNQQALLIQQSAYGGTPTGTSNITIVPSSVKCMDFQAGSVGRTTTVLGESGAKGIQALRKNGANTIDAKVDDCPPAFLTWLFIIFFGGGVACLVLYCLYWASTSFWRRIQEVDAPNPQQGNEGEGLPLASNARIQHGGAPVGEQSSVSPLIAMVEMPPVPKSQNEQHYQNVLKSLQDLQQQVECLKSLNTISSKSNQHFSQPCDQQIAVDIQLLFRNLEGTVLELQKSRVGYQCAITSHIMDDPAYVEGEPLHANYTSLLQQVKTTHKGLYNLNQAVHSHDVLRDSLMRRKIGWWLEEYEQKLKEFGKSYEDTKKRLTAIKSEASNRSKVENVSTTSSSSSSVSMDVR